MCISELCRWWIILDNVKCGSIIRIMNSRYLSGLVEFMLILSNFCLIHCLHIPSSYNSGYQGNFYLHINIEFFFFYIICTLCYYFILMENILNFSGVLRQPVFILSPNFLFRKKSWNIKKKTNIKWHRSFQKELLLKYEKKNYRFFFRSLK